MCDFGHFILQPHDCAGEFSSLNQLSDDQVSTLLCIVTPRRVVDQKRIGELQICSNLRSHLLFKRKVLKSKICGYNECGLKMERQLTVPQCWVTFEKTGQHLAPGLPVCVKHRRLVCGWVTESEGQEPVGVEEDEAGGTNSDEKVVVKPDLFKDGGGDLCPMKRPRVLSDHQIATSQEDVSASQESWESQEVWRASQDGLNVEPVVLGRHNRGGDRREAVLLQEKICQQALQGSDTEKVSTSSNWTALISRRYFVKVGFMVYMAESALGVTPGQVSLRFA